MPEELYTSRDFCELAEQFEELKRENEELVSDKMHLINAAMDGVDKYRYTAHDIAYRDLERKCEALEADYVISNRELLIKQVEINRQSARIAELEWQELTARIAELEAENARLKAEQAAPKKDVADLISGLNRASLALDGLEKLLKDEQSAPKVEYNLKAKSSIGFCSERAAKLIDNLGNAAWYYGHSCSFENYTAQIEADAALCDFVARLERREKDFNELVEIVLEVSRYHANMWNEKALLAWRALEKFLNKERQ